ncbi:hypothetical protein CLOM_g13927 [Closterium sp. NIES-68]|nr:hypothetical protein CLOM_g13927 [Closterium sp. NIES-68]GJP76800.1 hypothetical protein CLOP_g7260 [Closterium sp. NIES-67]
MTAGNLPPTDPEDRANKTPQDSNQAVSSMYGTSSPPRENALLTNEAVSVRVSESNGDHQCGHVHLSHRAPWLRAALLGANDGLVSVASLMVGVGAIDSSQIIISGLAGLVGGACSMAIGEYISVYGQRDIEEADVQKERDEFLKGPEAIERELEELAQIYVSRGLSHRLAREVAEELSRVDPVRAHARDELGIDMDDLSNPLQAALASAGAFIVGAIIPLLSAAFIKNHVAQLVVLLLVTTLTFIGFGMLGAWLGGANKIRAAARCTAGGWLAMGITYGILRLFGTAGMA